MLYLINRYKLGYKTLIYIYLTHCKSISYVFIKKKLVISLIMWKKGFIFVSESGNKTAIIKHQITNKWKTLTNEFLTYSKKQV